MTSSRASSEGTGCAMWTLRGGLEVLVSPLVVQPLALVVHELAASAAVQVPCRESAGGLLSRGIGRTRQGASG
jgi:hypothetical protein